MNVERGRVVAVDADALWVETVRASTCASCSARKGCGHGLLNTIAAGHRSHLRVLPGEYSTDSFRVDDEVEIGVPEGVVLRGALIVYAVPLLGLLGGIVLGAALFGGDAGAVLAGAAGLAMGLGLVRWHAALNRRNNAVQPRVVGRAEPSGSVVISP